MYLSCPAPLKMLLGSEGRGLRLTSHQESMHIPYEVPRCHESSGVVTIVTLPCTLSRLNSSGLSDTPSHPSLPLIKDALAEPTLGTASSFDQRYNPYYIISFTRSLSFLLLLSLSLHDQKENNLISSFFPWMLPLRHSREAEPSLHLLSGKDDPSRRLILGTGLTLVT